MKTSLLLLPALFVVATAMAQDVDLDKLLEQEGKKKAPAASEYTIATFKTTRISNGHSVEVLPAGVLDAKIQHRFGSMSNGAGTFFGLDDASIRLGVDYGITNRLMTGIGRSTYQKQVDAFLKYQLVRQMVSGGSPVTVTALASAMIRTDNYDENLTYEPYFSDRLSYALQLMVARKLSEGISLQLMPTLVHYNIVPKSTDPNDIISMGIGGRFKLTKRTSFNVEYYYNLPDYKFEGTRNAITFGFDIETGGHVFQLLFTNGQGVAERPFISETTGDFWDGDIHFGFNISRVFQIGGKRNSKS
jgi:Membrane bound beta barrel domain (DUF5777)